MADPLSIASGIAGLLSLAGTAFHVVHQYIRTVQDAKDFVKALSKELQSLSSVLQGVKILAEAYEQDETEPSVRLRLEHISACSRVLDDILKGTSSIRDTIKNQKSITSKVENLKWPFRKSKTDELINELSRHKATLSLALDAASLSALVDCLGKVSHAEKELLKIHEGVENLQILRQIQLDAERERVLNFFMPVDPSPNLQSSWKLRHPGTGTWLTESPRFRTWLSETGSKIWLSGIPGAGKTVLAGATIREALQQAATISKVGVAFFFCDYKNKDTWDITNILGAIATQLAWQNESAFAELKHYHDEIKPRQGTQLRPDIKDLHEVIIEESEAFDQVLLVVDGLDECGDNAEEVSRVLSRLSQDVPNLSSAFFSRDEPGIRDVLQDQFDPIDIAAHSEDIGLYVGAELDKRIEQRQLRINDTTLKDEILLRLTTGAQGMFRWVACQLDALGECVTDADRRTALYELPKTLPETYERILVRVNQKRRSVQRLVQLTLHFLAIKDPVTLLTAADLCCFVSVPEKAGTEWDSSSVVTEQEVLRACSSFLRKSAAGPFFEFAHFSVREYLQDTSLLERPDLRLYHISESSINDTVACQYLRFLQLQNFDCKPCRVPGDRCAFCTQRENLGSLYLTATISWPKCVHVIQDGGWQSSAKLLNLQKSLFHPEKSNVYMNWANEFYSCLNNKGDIKHTWAIVVDSGLSTLHIAAALDLTEVGTWLLGLQTTISSEIDPGSVLEFSIAGIYALSRDVERSRIGELPHYKLRSRTTSLMDQLSSRGGKLSESSEAFQSRDLMRIACVFAARQEMSPLKCLLENGWSLSSEDISIAGDCFTNRFRDFGNGNHLQSFIKFLNTRGVHKTREGHELCALIWNTAIRLDYNFTADTSLLPSDITLSDEALAETAVKAITYDDLETLITCEQDARFNIRELTDEDGDYAVHIAALHNSFETLKYMLNAGCEMLKSDSNGENFLHVWASSHTYRTIDTSALEEIREQHGVDFEKLMGAVNHRGQTPLDLAIYKGNKTPLKWLLEKHPIALGCCHGNACLWDQAANAEGIALLQMLKDSNFPCHTDCSAGQPFHALNPETNLEKFELLNALYPSSLKSPTSTKLALESCLSKWAKQGQIVPHEMDARVIRALLRNSDTLSPTSPAAIDFCCRIISGTLPSSLNPTIKILELLLKHGIDVHPESGSTSILTEACELFNRTTAQNRDDYIHLLEAILDRVDNKKLNQLDQYGFSILHRVCMERVFHLEWLVQEIVKRGADVNIFSGQFPHMTPLLASLEGFSKQPRRSAKILLELGADPALALSGAGWDAAQTASIKGHNAFLQDLLAHLTKTSTSFDWERKCSIFLTWDDSKRRFDGLNSMHMASIGGHQDCFSFFLDNGLLTDICVSAQEGFSCLHFAARSGEPKMIDYLVDLGLDVNQMAADGSTPLHVAVHSKSKWCVERLLSRGSLIKKDMIGMTPMMYARKLNLDEIVGLLTKFDTSNTKIENLDAVTRNAQTRYWRKALETAIRKNDAQTCSRILEEGCSVNVSLPACAGCSPLLLSIRMSSPGHCELVRLFLNKSASVCKQACSKHGSNSTLFQAIHCQHLNSLLPTMLDLYLHEGPVHVSGHVLGECIGCRNYEAVRIIINHVSDNKKDYARLLGCRPEKATSRLINNYGKAMPLHHAVIGNNLEVVKQLVQAGADVDGQDFRRMTPIQYCGVPESIAAEYLLSMGATPTLPPSITWLHNLSNSAEGQKRITAEIFRQASMKRVCEPFSPTPMMHPKVLAAIMDNGYDLNAKDESNRSIMLVSMHNSETATLMLNKPAQLTETGTFPWSTMGSMIEDASWLNQHWKHYLRRFRMEDLRRISNLEPRRGWSPLCLATCTDAIKVMDHCLEMGTDIDFEGSPYGSALMAAAGMNRIESVKFLVRHNASICYDGKQGFTSAVVVGASSQRVVQWLLIGRFQDQGKLEAVTEPSTITTENAPICSWSPARVNFRLCGSSERQPDQSSFDYLKALAKIKKSLRGQVVLLPKPEFLESSVVTAVYDI